ncbi:MAG: hypothetical protein RLZZ224_517, partial [Verrucomicrobiota bacterium]
MGAIAGNEQKFRRHGPGFDLTHFVVEEKFGL